MSQINRPFVISTDTTCDLPRSYLDERGILLHPLHYLINEEEYGMELEKDEPTTAEFFNMMRDGGMPTTNATSLEYDIMLFEKAVEQGYDVIHTGLASVLSDSVSNARLAAKEVMERHPEARIDVVDTCSGSSGLALLVMGMYERMKEGKSFNETLEWLEESAKNLRVFFSVANLMTLYRGGRLKKSAAIFGTALKIQPMLKIFPDGTLGAIGKVRGRSKALEGLVDKLGESLSKGIKITRAAIAHGDCEADARLIQTMLRDKYGIEDVQVLEITPTLGAHVGPDALIFGFIEGE